jgi:hypothetical protein
MLAKIGYLRCFKKHLVSSVMVYVHARGTVSPSGSQAAHRMVELPPAATVAGEIVGLLIHGLRCRNSDGDAACGCSSLAIANDDCDVEGTRS